MQRSFVVKLLALAMQQAGFTRYNLLLLSAGIAFRNQDVINVATCTSVGVLVAFYTAKVLDPTSFRRMCRRLDLQHMRTFYTLDLVVHILPCILSLHLADHVQPHHGLIAVLVNAIWGVLVFDRMDQIYVPMHASEWTVIWISALLTELCVPLTFFREAPPYVW